MFCVEVDAALHSLRRPLSLAEKVLYAHLADHEQELERGFSQIELKPKVGPASLAIIESSKLTGGYRSVLQRVALHGQYLPSLWECYTDFCPSMIETKRRKRSTRSPAIHLHLSSTSSNPDIRPYRSPYYCTEWRQCRSRASQESESRGV